MSAIISRFEALILIAAYATGMSLLIMKFSRGFGGTKLRFLLANREISKVPAAFSIADAWIWAPALFLSAEKAYTQGWVGLFWFLFGNVLCLILFAFFAERMRQMYPEGFTAAGYMRERYSTRVQNVYILAHGGLATCSFAVQLLAGGAFIAGMSGMPYLWVTIGLAVIPVIYTVYGGLRASVASDFLQLSLVFLIGLIIIPWAIYQGGGMETVLRGINGVTGTYTSIWSGDGWNVFLTFGLSATIGLIAGPFGDQSFWQRAFAVRRSDVKSAFLLAPWIFAVVPLGLGLLGFLAAGLGMTTDNASRINMQVVSALLPAWAAVLFSFLLLAGLLSKLDTNLASISSLAGHDLAGYGKGQSDRRSILFSRVAMLSLVLGGIAIANIPGLKLEYLFLTYGTLRSATLLPTVITLVKRRVSEAGMFYGIIISLAVGLPMFGYGVVNKILWLSISGTLFAVLASGLIVLVTSARRS